MDINYFDLSGGINQASTKTELGINTRKIYWTDSKNVEIYNNKGIIKQKGNTLIVTLPNPEKIIDMCEMETNSQYKLVIVTESGKIYIYSKTDNSLRLLEKTVKGRRILFAKFLKGILISTEADSIFYIKDNSNFDVVECSVKDLKGADLHPDCMAVYKGRVWCAKDSTIYYSALGKYDDFSTKDDAGYINDFHTDTSNIVALHTYKDYLAIYKKERVYLLSGSSPSDFSITLFADKGVYAPKSIVNVDNKQFFLSNGIYALEQVGELNQIRLGSEISQNIREEFNRFDSSRIADSFVVHYQKNHQIWFFFPYMDNQDFNIVWINDYLNRAWYKRVIPQKISVATTFEDYVVTADNEGNIYREDYGTTFSGQPIEFMWKSPFLSLGQVLHRKIIDEFYFVLDEVQDNKFNFSLYKDFDSEFQDDKELIYSRHMNHFIWAGEDTPASQKEACWNDEISDVPIWPISSNTLEKADICGSNYSIQICIEGREITDNCAIIGLQFREIYNDD